MKQARGFTGYCRSLVALFVLTSPLHAFAASTDLEAEYAARIAGFRLRAQDLINATMEASRFANEKFNQVFPTGTPVAKVSVCHPDKIAPGASEASARTAMHACFANADALDEKTLVALRAIVGTSISATLNKLSYYLMKKHDAFAAGVKSLGLSAAKAISEIGQCVAEAAGLVSPAAFVANAAAKTAYAATAGKMSIFKAISVGFALPSPAKVLTECKQAVAAARAHAVALVEAAKKTVAAVKETAKEVKKTVATVAKQAITIGKDIAAHVRAAAEACVKDVKKCTTNASLFVWEAIKRRVTVGEKLTIDLTLSVEIPIEGAIIAPGTQITGVVERTSEEAFDITLIPAVRLDVGVGIDVHRLGATGGISIGPIAKFRLTKAKHLRELAYLFFKGMTTSALTGLLASFGSAVSPVVGAIVALIGTGVTLKNLVQSETFYEFGGVVCQEASLRETEILKKIAFAELFVDYSMCYTLTGRRDRTVALSFSAELDALVASSGWITGLFKEPMTALKVAAVKDVRLKFGTSATATLGCSGSSKTSLSKSVMASIKNAFKACSPAGSVAFEATLGAGVHTYLLSVTFGTSVSTPKIPKGTKTIKQLLIALASGLPVQTLKLAVSKNRKRISSVGVGGTTATPDVVSAELMYNWEKPIYTCSLEVASGEFVKALLGKKPKFPASCAWNKPPSVVTKSAKTTTATPSKTTTATTTATARALGYSLGEGLRIRSEPTTQAEILGRLAKCASFEIVTRNVAAIGDEAIKSWTKVKSGNLTGYVASSYVGSSACSK